MKMNALAHASVDQLSLISLRLSPSAVAAHHCYVMHPEEVERFIYITKGAVCFFLQEGSLTAGERDMVYLPCNTAYRSEWLESSEFVVVDLLLRDGNGLDIHFGDAPCVLFKDRHHVYDSLLAELAQKADADGPFDWLERLSLTFKLLCEMARDTNEDELDEKNRRIKAGVQFLENNFAEDFSVDILAKMCSLSPSFFRRIFFSCKGLTPVDYRNRLRVRKAAELLKSGKYTVSEAAEKVGIRDIKYFGKLFKRYMGTNPSTWKKQCADLGA